MASKEDFYSATIEILGKSGGSVSESEMQARLIKPGTDVFDYSARMAEL